MTASAPRTVSVVAKGEGKAGASPSTAAADANKGDLFAAAGLASVTTPERPTTVPAAGNVVLREIEVEIFPDGTMTRENAARYLGISVHTLAGWAHLKTGPRYMKLRRKTYYRKADLDAWKACRFAGS